VFTGEGGATKLAALDNVVLTPHLGGMSLDAQRAIGRLVVDNLGIALDGGDAANRAC
jgi:phosphoglycerate dehydrogenase-like enzyme